MNTRVRRYPDYGIFDPGLGGTYRSLLAAFAAISLVGPAVSFVSISFLTPFIVESVSIGVFFNLFVSFLSVVHTVLMAITMFQARSAIYGDYLYVWKILGVRRVLIWECVAALIVSSGLIAIAFILSSPVLIISCIALVASLILMLCGIYMLTYIMKRSVRGARNQGWWHPATQGQYPAGPYRPGGPGYPPR